MRADADLVQRISRSEIYSEYEKAFGDGTGLTLKIRPVEFWNLAHHNRRSENPFCALMAQTNRSCAACLEVQQQASDMAKEGPATFTCFAGLCDTTVPIKLGDRTVGFLQTGQVALKKPSESQFKKITQKLVEWGSQVELKQLREAYFHSKVFSARQYAGAIRLLDIFGKHLSLMANKMMLQDAEAEPPMIRRAKAYIAGHHADPIDLNEIAKAMHVSTFTFARCSRRQPG